VGSSAHPYRRPYGSRALRVRRLRRLPSQGLAAGQGEPGPPVRAVGPSRQQGGARNQVEPKLWLARRAFRQEHPEPLACPRHPGTMSTSPTRRIALRARGPLTDQLGRTLASGYASQDLHAHGPSHGYTREARPALYARGKTSATDTVPPPLIQMLAASPWTLSSGPGPTPDLSEGAEAPPNATCNRSRPTFGSAPPRSPAHRWRRSHGSNSRSRQCQLDL
jgi:hypothetical protein